MRVVLGVGASLAIVAGIGWAATHVSWPTTARTAAIETPRVPMGVWCRTGDSPCRLWDRSGTRWGEAVPSVGTLLVLVDDQRSDDTLEPRFLNGILAAIDGLAAANLRSRIVTLPDAEPGGIRVSTSAGYDVYIDALGDVADQLSTLSVFLADRARDASFKPQYLDLRTPGRVYVR